MILTSEMILTGFAEYLVSPGLLVFLFVVCVCVCEWVCEMRGGARVR
jgi:hypothetical protein